MNTYRLIANQNPVPHWLARRMPLTGEALVQTVAGLTVRQLGSQPNGTYVVDVQLDRPDHAQALTELRDALASFGLQLVGAYVTEWANSWVEGTVAGALGGTALGASTKNAAATFAGFLAGLIIGGLMGRASPKVAQSFQAVWTGSGRRLSPAQSQAIQWRLA